MTALAPAPRRVPAERLQWLAPAPLWNDTGGPARAAAPWIAELTTDAFVPTFLAVLGGTDVASALRATRPASVAGKPMRLFQPLNQRYYLVCASLVCLRPGIPDRAVRRAAAERTSFVMRRLDVDGVERGWVPAVGPAGVTAGESGSWLPAPVGAPVPGEERLPLHPAPVAAFAAPGTVPHALGMAAGADPTRVVHYGYVPVGRRERAVPVIPDDEVVARVLAQGRDPAADELVARVVEPWKQLAGSGPLPSGRWEYPSLYLVLDLADWLRRYVPSVSAAILASGTAPTAAGEKLRAALAAAPVPVRSAANPPGPASVPLATLVADLRNVMGLVDGEEIAGPADGYDLRSVAPTGVDQRATWLSLTAAGGLARLAAAARSEEPEPVPLTVHRSSRGCSAPTPSCRTRTRRSRSTWCGCCSSTSRVRPCSARRRARSYWPGPPTATRPRGGSACRCPTSGTCASSAAASPSRPRRRCRRCSAGSPPTCSRASWANDGLGVAMICSFSLQIIFLCAFIVLFLFLIILNLVFWWLPFLKICFPVPVRSGSGKAPSP